MSFSSLPSRDKTGSTMLPDKEGPGVGGGLSSPSGEDPSVSLFREYLRLKTVHPEPDYGEKLLQLPVFKPNLLHMSFVAFLCLTLWGQCLMGQDQNTS